MSDRIMRAKVRLNEVTVTETAEKVNFKPVCGKFDDKGSSEDNTYAKYTPSGDITLTITNPELLGKLKPGKQYYVDFTEVPEGTPAA